MPILAYARIDTSSKAMAYLFDPASGRLTPFDIPSRQAKRNEPHVFTIGRVDGDWCWYQTRGINNSPTLYRERLVPFAPTPPVGEPPITRAAVPRQPIVSFHEIYWAALRDRTGAYWLTTDKGIARIIPIDPGIQTWRASIDPKEDRHDSTLLSWRIVSSVLVDRYGVLWVGTGVGLNRYEPATGRWRKYFHNPRQPGSLPADFIITIYEDHDGTLLFGTSAGLVAYDQQKDRFYNPYPSIRWPRSDEAGVA
jgi:hypothetical protein